MKAKVFFSREITPEKVVALYNALGIDLPGKVAVKLHSGEKGNQNFIRPNFWRPIIDRLKGTVVECNTAYAGERNYTDKHRKLIEYHGWNKFYTVDLMDAEGPDLELAIPEGKRLKRNLVGKNMANYDSMIVLSHFKGHPMGGAFLESMADAASSVVDYFKGHMAFINVMKNISVDCDCCAVAEDPCMKDVGILASLDPIAIDQACIDLVYAATDDPGQKHFLDRVESRHGIHTIEAAADLGFGSRAYELIEL